MELKFTLTVDEANLVLAALSNLPFHQVAGLIGNLKLQAEQQMTPPAAPEIPASAPNANQG